MSSPVAFTGQVPENYDACLGPLLFEPYAIDLAQRIGNQQGHQILELACGTGRVTAHLLKNLPATGRLLATDLNEAMLNVAKTKLKDERIQWQVTDAQNLPFTNNSFDAVVCQFGIMFFPDKPKAVAETFRVLKPGGTFLFNTWDHIQHNAATQLAKEVMEEVFPDSPPDFYEKVPFSFFNKDEIRQLLQEAGFTHISIDTVAKTGIATSPDTVITGLVDGTPVSAYMEENNLPAGQLKERFRERLVQRFGQQNLQLPMQAIVVEAKKG